MNSVSPWIVVAGVVAGLLAGGLGATAWWMPRMKRARRLLARLEASRQLLNDQTTQARRQIERMQLELGELRLIAERMRRKAATTGSPSETLDGPASASRLAEMPILGADGPGRGAHADDDDAGFANTQFEEPESNQRGFAPTQIDKPF